jgi:hypothetical protein
MEIIIEEISRGHKLLEQHKFSQSSINIGRGYHSDVILSDPHICAEHITIKHDGEDWRIIDQDSINGCFLDEGNKPAHDHIIHSGDIISIGKSLIRVIFPSHPVATSITLSPFENLIDLAKHPVTLFINILIFSLLTGWLLFLNNPTETNFTQLFIPIIKIILLSMIWPMLVALVSHLTKQEARIFTQIGICFIFYNLTWITDFIENLVRFNTSSQFPLTNIIVLLPIALAFSLFWLNCYVGFHMSSKRRLITAAGLTLLIVGGTTLIKYNKIPDFTVKPQFDSTLMTPNFMITQSSSVDDFINDSSKLFNEVRKAAKEKKK